MADISKPVLTARPRQMPIPAEPFLHGTEKVAGAFSPPTQRFPLLVSVRVFLLAETVQTCYFSEAFGRPGLRHAIGPMTKAMRKRMKAPNKSESVQKAVLSAGEGGGGIGLCIVVLRIFWRIMRHATIMNACLCKNGWKIDLDGIS